PVSQLVMRGHCHSIRSSLLASLGSWGALFAARSGPPLSYGPHHDPGAPLIIQVRLIIRAVICRHLLIFPLIFHSPSPSPRRIHNGPAGAFKQKGTVSLWKKAFAAPSTFFERVFWSFYSTVRSDMRLRLAFSWPYNLLSIKVLRITVYSCANAPAGPIRWNVDGRGSGGSRSELDPFVHELGGDRPRWPAAHAAHVCRSAQSD